MSYTPPSGDAAALTFSSDLYTPPAGSKAALEFVPGDGPVGDTQYVFPPGHDAAALGQNHVRLQYRHISPPAIPSTLAVGTPSALNTRRYVTAQGANFLRVGTGTSIQNLRRTIFNAGSIAAPPLGNGHSIRNRNRLLFIPGINALAFNTDARIEFWVRHVEPVGADAARFGAGVRVDGAWRTLHAVGFDSRQFGNGVVSGGSRTVPIAGINSLAFGASRIANKDRRITVPGINSLLAGIAHAVQGGSRYVHVPGPDTLRAGTAHRVERWIRELVGVGGLDALRTGSGHQLTGGDLHVKAAGFNTAQYGVPYTTLQMQYVAPAGVNAARYGLPIIANRDTVVGMAGIPAPVVPQPFVDYRIKYVVPAGIASGLMFGPDTWASHWIREFPLPGIPAPPFGVAWISESPRHIEPLGYFRERFGFPIMGPARALAPHGWDSQAFGDRIVPAPRFLEPHGFTGEFGVPLAWPWTQVIAARGFMSTAQEEYRWGEVDVQNLLQFVIQTFLFDSGLAPPPVSENAQVVLRNRTMGAVGLNALGWGRPLVENTGRAVFPAGIFPPDYPGTTPRGMVAFGVRAIRPDAIEAMPLSRWHAAHNDARVLAAQGADWLATGTPALANNRRFFRNIGAFDAMAFGTAFIADAIRKLDLASRGINPPMPPMPEVKLHTRYVEAAGRDMLQMGWQIELNIRWNRIVPRWHHRDAFGVGVVRNLTPEIYPLSFVPTAFGDAFLRLEWRSVQAQGADAAAFGRPLIAYRDKAVHAHGFNGMAVPLKHRVWRDTTVPYSPQTVEVVSVPGGSEVGRPGLNQFVLQPTGMHALAVGEPAVRTNVLRVEYGIFKEAFGSVSLALLRRQVDVGPGPDSAGVGAPRMTPHTIWAVKEAPQQAKNNHPPQNLHYVGETNDYPPGERFGQCRIALTRLMARNAGGSSFMRIGSPRAQMRRRYVQVDGIRALRLGWHKVGDGTEYLSHFAGSDTAAVGRPTAAHPPYTGPVTARPVGIQPPAMANSHWIASRHRTLHLDGFNMMRMGASRPNDTPWMWQGLRIGPLVPTVPQGTDMSGFGNAWVSLRVRSLHPEGFDTFLSEYDLQFFEGRMRVRNAVQPMPEDHSVTAEGLDALDVGVPNVALGAHFIRPDGNADQFRKAGYST